MAEWSNAAVLKTAEPETVPGVRIPLLPPPLGSLFPCLHHASKANILFDVPFRSDCNFFHGIDS